MSKSRLSLLAICSLFLFPISVHAVTHDVTVGNNFFSPNNLTIEVGDTVRWTNNSGRTHDVTADDFSWNSMTSSSFTFQRTFNSVEEVLYHCTVHSSPGQNRDMMQNGRINVIEADEPAFLINAGISDTWFNPATAGQGFLIIVWEDIQFVFLAWYTFDIDRPPEDVTAILGDPGHRWITAQGPYDGDTAMLDAFITSGGVFDSAEPATDTIQDGTIEVSFSGCNAGVVAYSIPSAGMSGAVDIERIVLGNVPACEAAQPAAQ